MVKWSACNQSVKEFKAKDGSVSACRALIKTWIRSHSSLREIVGKELKVEDKPTINQLEHSKIAARRVFQK